MEENIVHGIHSDYYQLHKINNIISTKQISKKFALYHVNTGSLDKHFDDLRTVLANVNITLNTYRTAVSLTLDLLCHEDFNVGRSEAESSIEIFMAQ